MAKRSALERKGEKLQVMFSPKVADQLRELHNLKKGKSISDIVHELLQIGSDPERIVYEDLEQLSLDIKRLDKNREYMISHLITWQRNVMEKRLNLYQFETVVENLEKVKKK